MNEIQDTILNRCIAFAVKIDKMKKYLQKQHHEYNKSNQVDRSGSAVGALYSEALCAESRADYIHKLEIAQKEAKETEYWLKVIYQCEYIDKSLYDDLMSDAQFLLRYLTATIIGLKKSTHNT